MKGNGTRPQASEDARHGAFKRSDGKDSGRALPHNAEAETAILSAMLINPNAVVPEMVRKFGLSGDVFFDPQRGEVFATVSELWNESEALDEITVANRLRERGKFSGEAVEFVNGLFNFLPDASNFENYAVILAEKKLLRDVIQDGTDILSEAYGDKGELPALVKKIEGLFLKTTARGEREARRRSTKEIVMDVMDSLSNPEEAFGIPTGFAQLDASIGGLASKAKIVIAGESSSGKSALAHNIAISVAVKRKIPTAYFSFEMSEDQTIRRVIQTHSEVSARDIVFNRADLFRVNRFKAAAMEIADAPLFVINERLDVAGIRARIMQLVANEGLRIAIIDYLQIIPEQKQRGESRTEQLDRMSAETKQIAHSLGLTIVELSQVTKSDNGLKTRGSMGIINDSDILLLIETCESDASKKTVRIAKQRDGAKDSVEFRFDGDTTKFREAKEL